MSEQGSGAAGTERAQRPPCRALQGSCQRWRDAAGDALVEQGRLRVRDVTTHHFALDDYARALATFNDPTSGAIKIIIEP